MSDIEKALLDKIIELRDIKPVLNKRITSDFFYGQDNKVIFEYLLDYYREYREIPRGKHLRKKFDYDFERQDEPIDYFIDEMRDRQTYNSLKDIMIKVSGKMKDKDVKSAYKALANGLMGINTKVLNIRDVDWTKNTDERKKLLLERESKKGFLGIKTGWKSFDDLTLGLQDEQLITIAARSSTGKSWVTCLLAYKAWMQKCKVLFISLEMSTEEIGRRLDAIKVGIPYYDLRKGQLKGFRNLYFQNLDSMKKSDCASMIICGNDEEDVISLDSISAKLNQYKPDVAIIDGVYILAEGGDKYKNTTERIASLVQRLKRMAQKHRIPIVDTVQMGRGAHGGKGGEDRQALVRWGDDWFNSADVFIELIQTAEMRKNQELRISVAKQREGDKGEMCINFNFSAMNFSEKVIEDMSEDEYERAFLGKDEPEEKV